MNTFTAQFVISQTLNLSARNSKNKGALLKTRSLHRRFPKGFLVILMQSA